MSQLIPSLAHMPFKAGNDLYFCHSDGIKTFVVEQTEFEKKIGREPQRVNYQPWRVAKLNGSVELINFEGLEPTSPSDLFCNPVFSKNGISFVYGRSIWISVANGTPIKLKTNIFTGYYANDVLAFATAKGGEFNVNGIEYDSNLDFILRLIPHDNKYILTGKKDGKLISILWSEGSIQKIQANGQDVYKCCIDGDKVIYAKKTGEFEDRHLFIDQLELVPL